MSTKALQTEVKIRQIIEDWDSQELVFADYRDQGPVMLKTKEIMEKLEVSQIALTIIDAKLRRAAQRRGTHYTAPLWDDVTKLLARLSMVSDVIEQWADVQWKWIYYYPLFTCSDISEQLPEEAKHFANIDRVYDDCRGPYRSFVCFATHD